MKKHALTALLLAAASATPALAAPAGPQHIAFIDREAALLDSQAAKTAQEKLQTEMKPQRDRLESLRRDIRTLEEKFQKEAATMSERDKKALRDQGEAKAAEFNALVQQVQKRTAEAQRALVDKTLPQLTKAIEDLRKEGGYDIILELRAMVAADPSLDLTGKLTERLNSQK